MEIEAFILIGGRSRRFGRDKAGVEFGNEPLIERTTRTIRNAISPTQITFVAANDGQYDFAGLPIVFDLYGGFGPIGGLHAALAYARTEWILVVACDLPLISSELIAMLAGMILDDIDACVPVQPDGHIQPLCALYQVEPCLTVLKDFFIKGTRSLSVNAFLDQLKTRTVTFDAIQHLPGSENFFLNMNTVDDHKQATEIYIRSRELVVSGSD